MASGEPAVKLWGGVLQNGPVGGNDHLSWKRKLIFPATLQGTNISPKNGILKMIFLFARWDMLIPWRVPFQRGSASFMECNSLGGGDGLTSYLEDRDPGRTFQWLINHELIFRYYLSFREFDTCNG